MCNDIAHLKMQHTTFVNSRVEYVPEVANLIIYSDILYNNYYHYHDANMMHHGTYIRTVYEK